MSRLVSQQFSFFKRTGECCVLPVFALKNSHRSEPVNLAENFGINGNGGGEHDVDMFPVAGLLFDYAQIILEIVTVLCQSVFGDCNETAVFVYQNFTFVLKKKKKLLLKMLLAEGSYMRTNKKVYEKNLAEISKNMFQIFRFTL